jgi:hypothetical protein
MCSNPTLRTKFESSERRIEGRYIEVAIMLRNTGDVNEKSKPNRLTDTRGDA